MTPSTTLDNIATMELVIIALLVAILIGGYAAYAGIVAAIGNARSNADLG